MRQWIRSTASERAMAWSCDGTDTVARIAAAPHLSQIVHAPPLHPHLSHMVNASPTSVRCSVPTDDRTDDECRTTCSAWCDLHGVCAVCCVLCAVCCVCCPMCVLHGVCAARRVCCTRVCAALVCVLLQGRRCTASHGNQCVCSRSTRAPASAAHRHSHRRSRRCTRVASVKGCGCSPRSLATTAGMGWVMARRPTAHTPWDRTHGQEAPRLTPHGTPPTGKRPHGSHPMGPHPWARGPTDHTPWDPTHGQWGYRLSRWGCHFPGRVSRSQQTSLWQRQ
jgi:hypothetical protein